MISERLSRTDIQQLAMEHGLDYPTAWDLACKLSPECRAVPAKKVARELSKYLA